MSPINEQRKQAIAAETQAWIKDVIIKYNLCPFARRELERQSIRFHVCNAQQLAPVLEALAEEWHLLCSHAEVETSLFILPRGFDDFEQYLELLGLAEALLHDLGYEGEYQLASFHPDYCFAGEASDDAANYTNRSPYPMLHILREDSMTAALTQYPEPEVIPERNIAFARRKGSAFFRQLLDHCKRSKS